MPQNQSPQVPPPVPTHPLLHALAPASPDPEEARGRFPQQQQLLSRLWVFATLNYLYCDVIGLMDANMLKQYAAGRVGEFIIDQNFLLWAAVLMQMPMSMVFLCAALRPRTSRIANIAAGMAMTAVQAATLFLGELTQYYLFSSAVELATTGFIAAFALFAMKPPINHLAAGESRAGVLSV